MVALEKDFGLSVQLQASGNWRNAGRTVGTRGMKLVAPAELKMLRRVCVPFNWIWLSGINVGFQHGKGEESANSGGGLEPLEGGRKIIQQFAFPSLSA